MPDLLVLLHTVSHLLWQLDPLGYPEPSGEQWQLLYEEMERLAERQLYPGMPAEVIIKTGERTALRYLLQPILDSMHRAWREE